MTATRYIGHVPTVSALSRKLPPVTLLIGPPSVGKWTLAELLASQHDIEPVDQQWYENGMGIADARQVIEFVNRAPFGSAKYVAINLDGTRKPALNALLKTLEEPPATARFVLTASKMVLPTVRSRAQVYPLGLLSDDEVRTILINHGFTPTNATRAARAARGQVRGGIQAAQYSDATRDQVLSIMRAVAKRDREAFLDAFRGFDHHTRELMMIWFREAMTETNGVFSTEEMFGLHRNWPRLAGMVSALSALSSATPRLAARAALEPYVDPSS